MNFLKSTLVAAFLLISVHAQAQLKSVTVPDTPPNACYDGCNDFMKSLLNDFDYVGHLPSFESAVYSGVCRHLGQYNGDVDHYAVMMLDRPEGKLRFSTMFTFFADENEYSLWDLATARKEMSPYWNEHGLVQVGSDTARVVINYDNGDPAYVYWFRQNLSTQEMYYITYAGVQMRSFCRLVKNLNQ